MRGQVLPPFPLNLHLIDQDTLPASRLPGPTLYPAAGWKLFNVLAKKASSDTIEVNKLLPISGIWSFKVDGMLEWRLREGFSTRHGCYARKTL